MKLRWLKYRITAGKTVQMHTVPVPSQSDETMAALRKRAVARLHDRYPGQELGIEFIKEVYLNIGKPRRNT